MMRWIVGSSLKLRRQVVVLAAAILVVGFVQLGRTPVDVLPEFSPPMVEVQTEALGLSAAEVEQLITVPLEQDLLNGVAFLDRIESASLPGLSSVVMTFEPGTPLLDARQVVQERLTQAHALPNVSKPPQMLQPLSSTSRVSMVQLSSERLSPIEMSVLARWVIVPRLLGVDGVANVAIWGQRERQLQVQVDPDRLRERGVSLGQIINTAGNALEVSPLSFLEASTPGTGGFIDTLNQRLQIFHEQAITTPEELAQVPLEDHEGKVPSVGGVPLTLGDVTEVVEDHQPLIGDALCRDGQCILLVVEKFPGANTVEVTEGVEAALSGMRPGLGDLEVDSSVYRPASFIESSFGNLAGRVLIGAVLMLLVVGLFFRSWRAWFVSAVALTVSLVAAALVLHLRGATINMMALAGLVMALGALVDDAVGDVDDVAVRLGRHRRESAHEPAWRAVVRAVLEMRRAALYAALIVLAAMLPALFMQGEGGAFLPPILFSYALAVAVSMVVALTAAPALAAIVLSGDRGEPREPASLRRLKARYNNVPRRGWALAVLIAALGAGLLALPFLSVSLRPSLAERELLIAVEAEPGTSLPKMRELVATAVDRLGSLPGVRSVGAHVGRALMSDRVVNVDSGEIWVNLDPSADRGTLEAIERVVDGVAGISEEMRTYSDGRVSDILQTGDDDIVVRLYGEDAEVLRDKADKVRELLGGVEGIEEPEVQAQRDQPALEVQVDLAKARAVGIKPGDVRRAATTLLSGITVGSLFEQQKVFDVVVWGAPEIRESVDDVQQLLIDLPGGGHVRLGQVADVRVAPNPSVIRHESVSRYLDVTAEVKGRSVAAVAGDVEHALGQVAFPLEHHAELLGTNAEQAAARGRVLAAGAAGAIGAFLLLQAAFTSWRLASLAFLTLPVALAGGLVGAWAAGGTVTLGSFAGLLAVLGIAARGSMRLIGRYQHLERHEGRAFGPELVAQGTRDRLGPMLASTFGMAMLQLPLVLAGPAAGLEIVRPMAVVILGGLVTSTLLHFVVLPALYLRQGLTAGSADLEEDLLATAGHDLDRAVKSG